MDLSDFDILASLPMYHRIWLEGCRPITVSSEVVDQLRNRLKILLYGTENYYTQAVLRLVRPNCALIFLARPPITVPPEVNTRSYAIKSEVLPSWGGVRPVCPAKAVSKLNNKIRQKRILKAA